MNIIIQVYDNDLAFTIFQIEQKITVVPDLTNLTSIMDCIILENSLFISNIILNEGSYLYSIQELQSISSLLNENSRSDQFGLISNTNSTLFPSTYGPSSGFAGVIPVNYL